MPKADPKGDPNPDPKSITPEFFPRGNQVEKSLFRRRDQARRYLNHHRLSLRRRHAPRCPKYHAPITLAVVAPSNPGTDL